ncbi:hypothetical protein D3C87_1700050 [compost metagenome]
MIEGNTALEAAVGALGVAAAFGAFAVRVAAFALKDEDIVIEIDLDVLLLETRQISGDLIGLVRLPHFETGKGAGAVRAEGAKLRHAPEVVDRPVELPSHRGEGVAIEQAQRRPALRNEALIQHGAFPWVRGSTPPRPDNRTGEFWFTPGRRCGLAASA